MKTDTEEKVPQKEKKITFVNAFLTAAAINEYKLTKSKSYRSEKQNNF